MGCNPKRWIWGLFPIAILTWIAALNEYGRIEADLGARAKAALARGGLGWATTSFDGRDGVLTGKGRGDGEAAKALEIIRDVWGVRVVEDRTDLANPIDHYVWSASLRGDRVKIAGFAPNEAAQKAIVGVARANFPKIEIADHMKLARDGSPSNAWLGGVSFALEQLKLLKRGNVYLKGNDLSVTGEATSPAAYKNLKATLHDNLPAGLRLASDKVVAPTVSPYTWEARVAANQLIVSGFAPSEELRERLFGRAKSALPWLTVIDRTEIALGAPPDWVQAAEVGLDQLARLEAGAVTLRDAESTIEGIARDEATAEQVGEAIKKETPGAFKAAAAVRAKSAPIEAASPFVTVVSALNGHVELTGYAPNNTLRAALVSKIATQSPGRAIDDRLRIATGAPPGWRTCLDAGLAALGRLGGVGRLELADQRLAISGRAEDDAAARTASAELKTAVGGACEISLNIDVVARPEPKLTWRAKWLGNELILEGEVSGAATRADLLKTAGQLFPGVKVRDAMRVAAAPSAKWARVATAGLAQLARLRHGEAVLSGAELTVAGEAPDAGTATSIREQLASAMAKGYVARDILDVRTGAMVADRPPRTPPEAPADERKAAEVPPAVKTPTQKTDARDDRASGMSATSGASEGTRVSTADRESVDKENECRRLTNALPRDNAIHFDRSSAVLDGDSQSTLKQLARIGTQCPRARIDIAGHTDAEGGEERNLTLSRQRAQSVADWLVEAGVDASRMHTVGYGEARPAAPNDTSQNRAKNRRIEFSVTLN